MPGVNWKYNDDTKLKMFWSISSDVYIYLDQLFIDFEFQFKHSLGDQSFEFELTQNQVDFLINGVEARLDKLVEKFNPIVPLGLTSVSNEYKSVKYNLFVKMSHNHRLLHSLITFHKFLIKSRSSTVKIIFWGGEIG
jgi:hypothetical protein